MHWHPLIRMEIGRQHRVELERDGAPFRLAAAREGTRRTSRRSRIHVAVAAAIFMASAATASAGASTNGRSVPVAPAGGPAAGAYGNPAGTAPQTSTARRAHARTRSTARGTRPDDRAGIRAADGLALGDGAGHVWGIASPDVLANEPGL